MTPVQLLGWVQLGLQAVTILGVPIANMIAFAKQNGLDDATVAMLVPLWQSAIDHIAARVAELEAKVAAGKK